MRKPTVSVIIPTKNRADKLQRAIASVGTAHEIIVVDDGSSDEEAKRIANLIAQTPNAKLIALKTSGGAPRARNLAAEHATGDVLAFLDSDDWWITDRLEAHCEAMKEPSCVLSYNKTRLTDPKTGEPGNRIVGSPAPRNLPMSLAIAATNYIGGCSSVCVRRSAFVAIGGFDPEMPSCQDWDLWLRLASSGHFILIPEASTIMDVGPHERITSTPTKVIDGHTRMQAKALALANNESERRIINSYFLLVHAEIASRFGQAKNSLQLAIQSLKVHPSPHNAKRLPVISFKALLLSLASVSKRSSVP